MRIRTAAAWMGAAARAVGPSGLAEPSQPVGGQRELGNPSLAAAPIIARKPEPTYGTFKAEVVLSFLKKFLITKACSGLRDAEVLGDAEVLRDAEVIRDAEEPEPTECPTRGAFGAAVYTAGEGFFVLREVEEPEPT